MPSTTSSSLSSDLPSSTVMTPSLPTLSIASAMILPIDSSLLAEIEPTWAISLLVVTGLDCLASSATAAVTALSMPRLRSMGLKPAATYFRPSWTMAWASTVAVVVPSPALSEVFEATSLTSWAPMFSNLSFSSISLATDTPSLVTVGAPNERSSTTLRPLGPRVVLTALARTFTPRTMRTRASSLNRTCLAAIVSFLRKFVQKLLDHGEDFFLADDEQLFAIDFHRLAGVLAEQHLVASLQVDRQHFTVFGLLARANGHDFALIRLFGGAVGNDDARGSLALVVQAFDDHAIV